MIKCARPLTLRRAGDTSTPRAASPSISASSSGGGPKKYVINADYVEEHLSRAQAEEDLNIFGFAAAAHKDKPEH